MERSWALEQLAQDGGATKLVGAGGAGPVAWKMQKPRRPNAVRPYLGHGMSAEKQEFTASQCREELYRIRHVESRKRDAERNLARSPSRWIGYGSLDSWETWKPESEGPWRRNRMRVELGLRCPL
jgi:hypothetical protein